MKLHYYLPIALSVFGLLPEQSMTRYLSPKPLISTSTDLATVAPLSKRELTKYCDSSDADAAFFKPTQENLRASRAGERYPEFTRNMTQSPELADKGSEPFLFAERSIGWHGFACGVDNNGCDKRPNCDDVLTRLGDKDEARWVYFVLESMHYMTKISAAIARQTVTSQVDLTPLAESAAHNFLWEYDEDIANKCKILTGLVKAAVIAAFALLGALVPALPAVAGALPVAVGSAVSSSAFLAAKGPTLVTFGVKFASSFPTNVGGDVMDRLKCPFANALKGLEEETRLQIKADMVKFYQSYRAVIEGTNNELIGGKIITDNLFLSPGTLLANVIQSGEYVSFTPEQAARFERQGYLIEADMTQYFKNALVSTLLKQQMCYIECSPKQPSKPDTTSFEPEDGKFCRARCWQNWKGEKNLELFGLKKMKQDGNEWGIETQAFLTGSYDHYKAHGFRADPMLPSQEDFYNNNNNDTPRPTSGSFLPVCDSHLSPPKQKSRHSGIPCMCGDKYGSGTAPFLEAANFASWKAVEINGDSYSKLGPVYLCQNDMAKSQTPPVEYFLNLCNMGWRWPLKSDDNTGKVKPPHGDDDKYLQRGKDPHCDAFRAEVEAFGGADDVNCWMCYHSDVGRDIQSTKREGGQIDKMINIFWRVLSSQGHSQQDYNFHRACQVWEENNGKCSGE